MKDNFLKKVIVCLGIFLLIFTVAIMIVFVITGGSEPSTLIACVFAACLGEASICGLLKNTRTKTESSEKINYNKHVHTEDDDSAVG